MRRKKSNKPKPSLWLLVAISQGSISFSLRLSWTHWKVSMVFDRHDVSLLMRWLFEFRLTYWTKMFSAHRQTASSSTSYFNKMAEKWNPFRCVFRSSGRKCVGVQHINYPECVWNRETLWNVREWSPYVSLAQRVVFYFHFFRFFSAALSFVCVNFAVHSYALYASIWSTSSGISLPLSHVDGRSINNGLLRRSIWKTHKDTHRRMQTRTNACTKRTQADAHSRTHRQKSNFSIFCLAFTGGQCYLRHILLRRFLSSLPLRCDHFSYALVCR